MSSSFHRSALPSRQPPLPPPPQQLPLQQRFRLLPPPRLFRLLHQLSPPHQRPLRPSRRRQHRLRLRHLLHLLPHLVFGRTPTKLKSRMPPTPRSLVSWYPSLGVDLDAARKELEHSSVDLGIPRNYLSTWGLSLVPDDFRRLKTKVSVHFTSVAWTTHAVGGSSGEPSAQCSRHVMRQANGDCAGYQFSSDAAHRPRRLTTVASRRRREQIALTIARIS